MARNDPVSGGAGAVRHRSPAVAASDSDNGTTEHDTKDCNYTVRGRQRRARKRVTAWQFVSGFLTVRNGIVILVIPSMLLLASFLRLYCLDTVPTGLYIDEVAMSVEARSLGQTLRDLDGNFLPLFPSAKFSAAWGYNDMLYQPIYVYSKIPLEYMLRGRSSVALARLTSVAWGLCSIATSSALAWMLCAGLHRHARLLAALLTGLLLTVSPWHHHFSRLGFEVISCPAFVTAGLALLMSSHGGYTDSTHQGRESPGDFCSRPRRRALGIIVLGLSAYAYHTARVFAPLLALAYCVCFLPSHRRWRSLARQLLATAALLVAVMLPLLYHEVSKASTDGSKLRSEWFQRNFVFTSNFDHVKRLSPGLIALQQWCGADSNISCSADVILKNQQLAGLFALVWNYFSYLSPVFLFWQKDTNARHTLSNSGVLLTPTVVPLLVGIAWLMWNARSMPATDSDDNSGARPRMNKRHEACLSRFILFWFLAWPVPASLCVQTPHAIRTFIAMPVLELISAYGVGHTVNFFIVKYHSSEANVEHSDDDSGDERKQNSPVMKLKPMYLYMMSVLYSAWLLYAIVTYHQRYIAQYAEESLRSFNYEASMQSFFDLKEAEYYNMTRVLVAHRVDHSFVYILYAEDLDYHCIHRSGHYTDLNELLKGCGLPYQIALGNAGDEFEMTANDLLLLDRRSLHQYSEEVHKSFLLLNQWYNFHGVVRLHPDLHTHTDMVDDEDEF